MVIPFEREAREGEERGVVLVLVLGGRGVRSAHVSVILARRERREGDERRGREKRERATLGRVERKGQGAHLVCERAIGVRCR